MADSNVGSDFPSRAKQTVDGIDAVRPSTKPIERISKTKLVGRQWIQKFQDQKREQRRNCKPGSDEEPCSAASTTINRLEDLKFNLFRKNRFSGTSNAFHPEVFVFEFLTHVFYPLSIPAVIMVQGKLAAVNKGFIPGKPVFVGQVLYTVVFLLPIVLSAARSKDEAWAIPAVIIGSAYTAYRMLVTAGKYASFKRKKYRSVMYSDYDCSRDLLLNSIHVEEEMVELLVDDAERESGIRLCEMHLLLADGVTRVNARVYASALARSVFLKSEQGNVLRHNAVRTLLAIVASLYPLERFLHKAPDTNRAYSIVLLVSIMLQNIMLGSVVFGFLGFSILYYRRLRAIKVAHVSSLLFTGSSITSISIGVDDDYVHAGEDDEDEDSDEEGGDMAMIPACSAKNLIVWATIGNVFSRFGSTFTRRMSFNFIANLLICLFLAGALILQVWNNETDDLAFVAIISFIFAVTAIGMLVSVFLGFLANNADDRVIKRLEEENFAFLWRERMSAQHMEYLEELHAASPDTVRSSQWLGEMKSETYTPFLNLEDHRAQAEEYKQAMEIVRELVQRRNEVEPLRVMYVPASIELVSFFVSLVASGTMLIVGVLYQTVPTWGT